MKYDEDYQQKWGGVGFWRRVKWASGECSEDSIMKYGAWYIYIFLLHRVPTSATLCLHGLRVIYAHDCGLVGRSAQ